MKTSVLERLASSNGTNGEAPNIELAEWITRENDTDAVRELVSLLQHRSKAVQSDAVKVLYECGERQPALIAPYMDAFVSLLGNNNNRLIWGAMTALDMIASVNPAGIHARLGVMASAAAKGSVITKDHFIAALIKLMKVPAYTDDMAVLLLDELRLALSNQLPAYAEQSVDCIPGHHRAAMIRILSDRLADIEKDSKRKRLEKVIRKLGK